MIEEQLDPSDDNDMSMHTVVRLQLDIHERGGGDHIGDHAKYLFNDQFVWGFSGKAELGWCMAVHVVDMLSKYFRDPKELKIFADGVASCVADCLDDLRADIETLDNDEALDNKTDASDT